MANKKFLTNIDLAGNDLRNAVLSAVRVESIAELPLTAAAGTLAVATGTNSTPTLYVFTNGNWQELVTSEFLGSTLTSNINNVQGQIDNIYGSLFDENDNSLLTAEISNRQSADASLQASIDAEASARTSAIASAVAGVNADLATETSARQSADSALDGRVSALESSTATADAVAAEASARQSADTALGGRIDSVESSVSAEVTARQAAVAAAESAASAAVSSEASARAAADSDLAADIVTAQAAAEAHADAAASSAQAAANTYTDGKIADLVDGAPELLNTLSELAAAIAADESAAAALTTQVGLRTKSESHQVTVTGVFSEVITTAFTSSAQAQVFDADWNAVEVGITRAVDEDGNITVTVSGNAGAATETLNVSVIGL